MQNRTKFLLPTRLNRPAVISLRGQENDDLAIDARPAQDPSGLEKPQEKIASYI